MNGDVMTDGDITANMCRTCLVGHMDARTVLDIRAIANRDGSHVASHHGIKPYRALVAHLHIADNGGVLTEIAVMTPLRGHTFITLD